MTDDEIDDVAAFLEMLPAGAVVATVPAGE
jgi:hypothetical protein